MVETIKETIKASMVPISTNSRDIFPHKMTLKAAFMMAVNISELMMLNQRKCHGFIFKNLWDVVVFIKEVTSSWAEISHKK